MAEEDVQQEEGVEPQQAEGGDDDIESRARSMGWKPYEEWSGNPEDWVPAEDFVQKGEETLPILRERYKKLDQQYRTLEQKLEENQKVLNDLKKHHDRTAEREYERARKEILEEQRRAAQEGDVEAFDQARQKEEELAKSKPDEGGEEETQGKLDPQTQKVLDEWVSDNPWYENDATLQAVADAKGREIAAENPNFQFNRAFLDEVGRRVKKEMPHKFQSSKKQAAPVDSGSPAPSGKKGKWTYNDLPAEEKKACDRFVNKGLMTREQYIEEYRKLVE